MLSNRYFIQFDKLLIILLALLFISCSKDYLFYRDQEEISKELKRIKTADQVVRNIFELIDRKYKIRTFDIVCDSLYKAQIKGNLYDKFDFSSIPSLNSQLAKFNQEVQNEYRLEKKEATVLIDYVDETNREKLYRIVKKYGFPSFYNRKWKDTINLRVGTAFIFTHYNYEIKKERKLLKLIIKEYFKQRIDEGEMKQIMWSVDGRNGYPYNYSIDKNSLKKRLQEN